MSDDLVRRLEAEGQEDLAQTLRQRRLSERLRDEGHTDLADQPGSPPLPPAPVENDGEAFLQELKDASNRGRVSIPGLLDE